MMTFEEWLKEYNRIHNTKYNKEDYQNNELMRQSWQNYKYGITTNNGDGTTTTTYGDGSTATQQIPSNNENYGLPNTGAITMNNEEYSIKDYAQDNINAINATNATNIAIANAANDLQRTMFDKQVDLSEREFANQVYENQIMREREDTAVSRRMSDLANAGINPLYAGILPAGANLGTTANAHIQGFQPVTPSLQAPTTDLGAIASENASKRQAETAKAQLEQESEKIKIQQRQIAIEEEKMNRAEKQFYDQLGQAYDLAGKDRELKKELSNANSELQTLLKNMDNMTQKEIEEKRRELSKELAYAENELRKRGQNIELITSLAKIIESGLMIGALSKGKKGNEAIKGDKWGEPLKPKLNEFNPGNPAQPGWSSGGIYYGN